MGWDRLKWNGIGITRKKETGGTDVQSKANTINIFKIEALIFSKVLVIKKNSIIHNITMSLYKKYPLKMLEIK